VVVLVCGCVCGRFRLWPFSKSVVVSVAVSKMGVTELMFVDPEVKVNGLYYRNVLCLSR